MSLEKLQFYTDDHHKVAVKIPPYGELEPPLKQEELYMDAIGRLVLAGVVDIQRAGFNPYDCIRHDFGVESSRADKLAAFFSDLYNGQPDKPEASFDSHGFVGKVENNGLFQTPPTLMVQHPLSEMQDGEPHTLLDAFGRPIISGYPMVKTGTFLTCLSAGSGPVLISSQAILDSKIIAHQAPVLLYNDPRWS